MGESVPPLIWEKVWKLDGPNSLKDFVWRACREALPTSDNVNKRIHKGSPWCPMCRTERETNIHILRDCSVTKNTFHHLFDKLPHCGFSKDFNCLDWVSFLFQNLHKDNLSLLLCGLWHLWKARNKMVFDNTPIHIHTVIVQSTNALQMYKDNSFYANRFQTIHSWSPPTGHQLKANFDGAFDCNSNSGAYGCIIRDHRGKIILSSAANLSHCASPFDAEMRALEITMEIIEDEGLYNISVEGDCLELIEFILEDRSTINGYIHSRKKISQVLGKIEGPLKWIPREGNRAADAAAKEGLCLSQPKIWRHSGPPEVLKISNSECNVLFCNNSLSCKAKAKHKLNTATLLAV